MYPNLYYAFKDLFGLELTGLRFINSFGFFVAIAFLAAAMVLTNELRRKQRMGVLHGTDIKIVVGKPANAKELLLNFLLGFILGYKIIGLFLAGPAAGEDPQRFIFSSEGNWLTGFIFGVFFMGIKWWEKKKQLLAKPEERSLRIWPHDRVGDIVIYAALFGFLGAKIFHNLENWDEFSQNPVEALLSFSGLTFYGGLICAAIAIFYYARKHKIGFRHLCDAAAPALILAYAIGRIGCQVSGDGDWGILNSAYYTDANNKSVLITENNQFEQVINKNRAYYTSRFEDINQIPNAHVTAPSWLPNWMVAYSYPNNVLSEGERIPGCTGPYCSRLPIPVFPTPFYETIACLGLFAILWGLRKKIRIPGALFAIYLILNGLERFLIEKIRVNTTYTIFGFKPTQAELIATGLVISGIVLYFFMKKKYTQERAGK